MNEPYLICPQCDRKTIYHKEKRRDLSCYRCKNSKCRWYVFTQSGSEEDATKLDALEAANHMLLLVDQTERRSNVADR